jgi:hypothetical protein
MCWRGTLRADRNQGARTDKAARSGKKDRAAIPDLAR